MVGCLKKCCAVAVALAAGFGAVAAQAQITVPDYGSTEVGEIAQGAATGAADILVVVATAAAGLLVIGAGIMFIWKFVRAGRAGA